MRELDTSHETVRALELLVPEAIVAGGSFAKWLPHPQQVQPAERETLLLTARRVAVAECIRGLLRRIGVDEDTTVAAGDEGDREWPVGFVGSLTHKGTVVLGAIARSSRVRMVGIDLERMDRASLSSIESTVTAEGLAPGFEPEEARLLSFSAKEAVFKAQFPTTRRHLGFADVVLDWERGGREGIRAIWRSQLQGLDVRASFAGRWVVSAAISLEKPAG